MTSFGKLILSACLVLGASTALADGTETLGAPGIAIASGTGIVVEGTGMFNQPGTISFSIPAGAAVKQVLLYWEGFMATNVPGDDTLTVSSDGGATTFPVTGTLIGGPTYFFKGAHARRSAPTSLAWVS